MVNQEFCALDEDLLVFDATGETVGLARADDPAAELVGIRAAGTEDAGLAFRCGVQYEVGQLPSSDFSDVCCVTGHSNPSRLGPHSTRAGNAGWRGHWSALRIVAVSKRSILHTSLLAHPPTGNAQRGVGKRRGSLPHPWLLWF